MAFLLNKEQCVGCGACAFVCLYHAIAPADSAATCYEIYEKACVECGQCSQICPNSAITAPKGWKPYRKVWIDPEKCTGCSICSRVCPAKAPQGELRKKFEIDQSKCFQCGACVKKCRFDAIKVEYE